MLHAHAQAFTDARHVGARACAEWPSTWARGYANRSIVCSSMHCTYLNRLHLVLFIPTIQPVESILITCTFVLVEHELSSKGYCCWKLCLEHQRVSYAILNKSEIGNYIIIATLMSVKGLLLKVITVVPMNSIVEQ